MASAQRDYIEMAATEVFDPSLRRKRKATEEDPVLLEDLQRLTSYDAMAPMVRKEGGTLSASVGRDHSILWGVSPDGKIQYQIRNRAGQLDSVEDFPAHGIFDNATGRALVLTWHRKEKEHRDPNNGPAQIWFNYDSTGTFYGQFLRDGEHVPLTRTLAMEWSDPSKGRALYAKYPGIKEFDLLFGEDDRMVRWFIYGDLRQITGYSVLLLLDRYNDRMFSFKGLPGFREWRSDWTPKREMWYNELGYHRDFGAGPAVIVYDEYGDVTNEEYWDYGEQERDMNQVRLKKFYGFGGTTIPLSRTQ